MVKSNWGGLHSARAQCKKVPFPWVWGVRRAERVGRISHPFHLPHPFPTSFWSAWPELAAISSFLLFVFLSLLPSLHFSRVASFCVMWLSQVAIVWLFCTVWFPPVTLLQVYNSHVSTCFNVMWFSTRGRVCVASFIKFKASKFDKNLWQNSMHIKLSCNE